MISPSRSLSLAGLFAVVAFTPAAHAGPDNVGLGTGRDGAFTATVANTSVNSYVLVTSPVAPGDTAVTVSSSTTGLAGGFQPGRLVLVLQATGIVPEPASSATGPAIDLGANPVGRWELARISAVTSTTITFTAPLVGSYAATVTQLVTVPEYTTVSVNPSSSLVPVPWNGATGGVVAFLATGTVTLSGSINANGAGFRGGSAVNDGSGTMGCSGLDEPSPAGGAKGEGIAVTRFGPSASGRGSVANGGGGGVCLSSGGGGGAGAGTGGRGGRSADGARPVGGEGGSALFYPALTRLALGGGGGAGHAVDGFGQSGGRGGGIVFVRASSLSLSSTARISASGQTASTSSSEAGSGGGAGGTILARFSGAGTCLTGTPFVATGAPGGSTTTAQRGPGGGGGGGRVLVQFASGSCATPASSVAGAAPGTQPDTAAPDGVAFGATAGSSGQTTTVSGGFPVLAVPQVTAPAAGTSVSTAQPTFAGTVSAPFPGDTQVRILVDDAEVGTAAIDASGNWSLTPATALSEGAHQASAVAFSAANAVESVASAPQSFFVDSAPPVLSNVPAPDVVEASSGAGATVEFTAPTATDAKDGARPVSCAPGSGSTFAIGDTLVTCSASDLAGNTATASFTVSVRDTTAPAFGTLANLVGEATSSAGREFTITAPAATDAVDGELASTCTREGAFTFAVGTTVVSCSAQDAHGNVGRASFSVQVVDTTAPTLELSDLVAEATSAGGAEVTFAASASDLVDGQLTASCTPASGATFALGDTSVQCSATDAHANAVQASFTVTVRDTTAPELTLPSALELEATSSAGAAASFQASAHDAVDGDVAVSCTPASGESFALGDTAVECTATDARGQSRSGTFPVHVRDTTAPAVSCPGKVWAQATSASGATVTFNAPTATDAVTAAPQVSASPASGSAFPVGTTDVTVSATDAAGNVSTCSFQVTVEALEAPAPEAPGGCGCSSGVSGETSLLALAALGLALSRRRRIAG